MLSAKVMGDNDGANSPVDVIGFATLSASVIFGVLYQTLGSRVAFGTGAALAVLASVILPSSPPTASK